MKRDLFLSACFAAALCAFGGTTTIQMQPGEHWWGLCNNFGREMPFTEKSDFSCNLRRDNYSHQSLLFGRGKVECCADEAR